MKKVKILIVTLIFMVFYAGINACNGDSDIISEKDNLINGMSIGEFHNHLMDKQKDVLIAQKNNRTTNSKIVLNSMKEELKSDLITNLNISSYEYDNFIKNITQINYEFNSNNKLKNNQLNLETQLNQALGQLNDKELANDLRTLVDKANTDTYIEFEKFSDLLIQKYSKTEHELLINSIIDVSLHSYRYWKDNNDTTSRNAKDGVWQADISGAVIGGTWGAVSGSFAGGIGALPGGLLGACIASSYGSAAAGLWSAL